MGIPCTLHVLEYGPSSYHTTHTLMPCTSAYSTYSMNLILEADTVEEVHCEASPLLGLVPNLNLITAVRMVYTRSALGGHRSTYVCTGCTAAMLCSTTKNRPLTALPILEGGVEVHPTEGHLKKRNSTTCHPSESAQRERERHFAYSRMRVKEMLVPTPPKCRHAPSRASQQQILQSRSVSWSLLPPLERCAVERRHAKYHKIFTSPNAHERWTVCIFFQ